MHQKSIVFQTLSILFKKNSYAEYSSNFFKTFIDIVIHFCL